MQDVKEISTYQNDWLLDTGSPHLVTFAHPVEQLNVYDKGRSIRYSERFSQQGININFAERRQPDCLFVRTYERGVENETLSCGTGVTAAALACHPNEKGHFEIIVDTLGGRLSVRYDNLGHQQFTNIWLSGPAERVFDGTLML
jgi:diaminopimelate epimerase